MLLAVGLTIFLIDHHRYLIDWHGFQALFLIGLPVAGLLAAGALHDRWRILAAWSLSGAAFLLVTGAYAIHDARRLHPATHATRTASHSQQSAPPQLLLTSEAAQAIAHLLDRRAAQGEGQVSDPAFAVLRPEPKGTVAVDVSNYCGPWPGVDYWRVDSLGKASIVGTSAAIEGEQGVDLCIPLH